MSQNTTRRALDWHMTSLLLLDNNSKIKSIETPRIWKTLKIGQAKKKTTLVITKSPSLMSSCVDSLISTRISTQPYVPPQFDLYSIHISAGKPNSRLPMHFHDALSRQPSYSFLFQSDSTPDIIAVPNSDYILISSGFTHYDTSAKAAAAVSALHAQKYEQLEKVWSSMSDEAMPVMGYSIYKVTPTELVFMYTSHFLSRSSFPEDCLNDFSIRLGNWSIAPMPDNPTELHSIEKIPRGSKNHYILTNTVFIHKKCRASAIPTDQPAGDIDCFTLYALLNGHEDMSPIIPLIHFDNLDKVPLNSSCMLSASSVAYSTGVLIAGSMLTTEELSSADDSWPDVFFYDITKIKVPGYIAFSDCTDCDAKYVLHIEFLHPIICPCNTSSTSTNAFLVINGLVNGSLDFIVDPKDKSTIVHVSNTVQDDLVYAQSNVSSININAIISKHDSASKYNEKLPAGSFFPEILDEEGAERNVTCIFPSVPSYVAHHVFELPDGFDSIFFVGFIDGSVGLYSAKASHPLCILETGTTDITYIEYHADTTVLSIFTQERLFEFKITQEFIIARLTEASSPEDAHISAEPSPPPQVEPFIHNNFLPSTMLPIHQTPQPSQITHTFPQPSPGSIQRSQQPPRHLTQYSTQTITSGGPSDFGSFINSASYNYFGSDQCVSQPKPPIMPDLSQQMTPIHNRYQVPDEPPIKSSLYKDTIEHVQTSFETDFPLTDSHAPSSASETNNKPVAISPGSQTKVEPQVYRSPIQKESPQKYQSTSSDNSYLAPTISSVPIEGTSLFVTLIDLNSGAKSITVPTIRAFQRNDKWVSPFDYITSGQQASYILYPEENRFNKLAIITSNGLAHVANLSTSSTIVFASFSDSNYTFIVKESNGNYTKISSDSLYAQPVSSRIILEDVPFNVPCEFFHCNGHLMFAADLSIYHLSRDGASKYLYSIESLVKLLALLAPEKRREVCSDLDLNLCLFILSKVDDTEEIYNDSPSILDAIASLCDFIKIMTP